MYKTSVLYYYFLEERKERGKYRKEMEVDPSSLAPFFVH